MNQLSILISYFSKHNHEIMTFEKLQEIINFDECSKNERTEIYKYVLQHNNETIEFHRRELKKNNTAKTLITFTPVIEEKQTIQQLKKDDSEVPVVVHTYLSFFKATMSDTELERIVNEIYAHPLADTIISNVLLHLNGEKASIIKLLHDANCEESDAQYLRAEIEEIDKKIEIIESAEIKEESVEIKEEIGNVVLFVLPSGNIALEKDLNAIKSNLYNDVTYYQDIIELLEAVKTGRFLSPKKLQDLGNNFEDRNGQCRLTFVLYNNMCIITSLFIKKSDCDVGTYSTLKARAKMFNQVKDVITPNENDINVINGMIEELTNAISKKVKND